ncbi:MAG: NAD(P)/FAD-dependent oxidoreductase [Betaproteobacteria bacterium]|nr:NAD(P)/FAD-dependent oxidoreductase [Betaproteobacteria bacterium]
MLRITELRLPLEHPDAALEQAILNKLRIPKSALIDFSVFKRSYDARRKSAMLFVYSVDVTVRDEPSLMKKLRGDVSVKPSPVTSYKYVGHAAPGFEPAQRPVVVGFGPCGIFAALILAQMGLKPIVLERGKAVRERTQDTWGLWRKHTLDPESNVQFGEGGAGTFSDGKLYSQIKDPRHLGRKVMSEFVKAGAPAEIMYVSKPHVGTFRLVGVVETIRAEIIALGGEVKFQHRLTDLLIENGQLRGLKVLDVVGNQTLEIRAEHLVLAVGHSARDTFEMLHKRNIYLEAKPFSIGFRIEHPQSLIDRARLGPNAGNPLLGAADYKLVHHAANGRSVYSFCMCPGGTVVAATSEAGRVVTNGMSQYSRNERNANAGIVVGIDPRDYPGGPLAGIAFQRQWESRAFELGGGNYDAPAQLVGDFLAGRASTTLGEVKPSYTPGVHLTDLSACLPDYAIAAIREAIPAFDKQISGFAMNDAVLTGVETRTSSPLKITRGEDFQSINVKGLYPGGEGASYAGGILSAGVDGIKIAEAIGRSILGIAWKAGDDSGCNDSGGSA